MENNTQISDQYDDEIDLRELFAVLWAGKAKIIVITAVFAIASVIYALSVPNQYKATALLAPCLLYTSPSPRDQRGSRMPSSA